MSNKGLLAIIAVVLIGIFTILLIQANEQTPAEEVAESISNVADSIGSQVNQEG